MYRLQRFITNQFLTFPDALASLLLQLRRRLRLVRQLLVRHNLADVFAALVLLKAMQQLTSDVLALLRLF